MQKVVCPYCKHIQPKFLNDEKAKETTETFNWELTTTVFCKNCNETFVQENNLLEEDLLT
jgi:uncharacterized protein YbaR (Trm112 family)